MNKALKIWLIVASSLILLGCIVMVISMSILKWDFSKLSSSKYQTNIHEITEEFKDLSILTSEADLSIIKSDESKCIVECYEEEKAKNSVSVIDNALVIKTVDERKWYNKINIFDFSSPKIKVYLPRGEYDALSIQSNTGDVNISKEFKFGNLKISVDTGDVENFASVKGDIFIKTSTGDIELEGLTSNNLDLKVSTGDISLKDINCEDIKIEVSTGDSTLTKVNCKNLFSIGNTGDIDLRKFIATEKISIKRSTGEVEFEETDAFALSIETSTGDVKGSLLSPKIFRVETDTGRRDFPFSTSGGLCEITTDTGDVVIRIKE